MPRRTHQSVKAGSCRNEGGQVLQTMPRRIRRHLGGIERLLSELQVDIRLRRVDLAASFEVLRSIGTSHSDDVSEIALRVLHREGP